MSQTHTRTIHAATSDLGPPFCGVRDALRRQTVGPDDFHRVNCRLCGRIVLKYVRFIHGLNRAGGQGEAVGVGLAVALTAGLLGWVATEPTGPASVSVRLLPSGWRHLARLGFAGVSTEPSGGST